MTRRLVSALLLAAAAAVLAVVVVARAADLRFQAVLSNSMLPTAAAGDLAVTQPVDVDSLVVGDVIAFFPPGGERAVLHRITSINGGTVTTRGDANAVDDPWRATLSGHVAYRLIAVIPLVGWLTTVRGPLLIIAGLVFGAAIALELWREVRARPRNVDEARPV